MLVECAWARSGVSGLPCIKPVALSVGATLALLLSLDYLSALALLDALFRLYLTPKVDDSVLSESTAD